MQIIGEKQTDFKESVNAEKEPGTQRIPDRRPVPVGRKRKESWNTDR